MSSQTGGQIVARTLSQLGADVVFSVSGNQILPIYDAAQDHGPRIIHTRHETAAAYAALAAAEVRNLPGVVLVSAGPGFLAALQGIAAARTMELPLLFLSGASPREQQGRGAFQDLDQQRVAGAICKTTMQATSMAELQSELVRAWQAATENIPGPVHVSLPADLLLSQATDLSLENILVDEPEHDRQLSPETESRLDAIAERLGAARRPLIIARPSASRFDIGDVLQQISQKLQIEPIITESPRGLHDLKYRNVVPHLAESDCTLVVGPSDFAVDFLAESTIASDGDLLLIDDPNDPSPTRDVQVHLQADPAAALSYLASRTGQSRNVSSDWSRLWDQSETGKVPEQHGGDGIHPLQVAATVREQIRPEDTVILDGGEFCQWIRLELSNVPNKILWNGKIGAIGGSIPMAVGVASVSTGGRVIAILGDGAAGYHLSEFETAARYGLPITAIVGNDARWSAEWHMQAKRYGADRVYETGLLSVPYEQAAEGFGGDGDAPNDLDSIRTALSESLASPRPTCLNVRIQSVQSPAALE